LLEQNGNGLVDNGVHDTCHGKHTTDYGADVDKELEEVFLGLGVLDGYRRELVVEHNNRHGGVEI
jgi:hypothetical protein